MALTKSELIEALEAAGVKLTGVETMAELKVMFDALPPKSAPEPAPPPAPGSLQDLIIAQQAMMQQMATALSMLAAQGSNTSGQEALTQALARLSEANLEGSKLIASETRRANRPSNEVVPKISVFNRRGELLPDDAEGPRKPKLKCLMLIPWLVEWESVTREEAELLNLLEPGDYTIKRVDNSKVRVTVNIELHTDGRSPSRLLLNHDTAFNNDNFRLIPALADMLRQILKQHRPEVALMAANVMEDEVEEMMIEAGRLSVSV